MSFRFKPVVNECFDFTKTDVQILKPLSLFYIALRGVISV